MRKLKKLMGTMLLMTMLASKSVYASELNWEALSESHNQSVLLQQDKTESMDAVDNSARGMYLSTAMLEIQNEQNGNLHIGVDTLTHVYVDRIYQVVFLDVWDETKEDWQQIGKWTFERTKEEEENLASYYVGFTVTDCPVNRYYRARAMHLVEVDDIMEGKATETNGVLLTDHEV